VGACVDAVPEATDTRRMRFFVEGVGTQMLIPAIRSEAVWEHPSVAAVASPAVISGLRSIADRALELVEGMSALPQLPVHGDASPQNLLIERPEAAGSPGSFVVIDWGNLGRGPTGP
jgi:aminoglycoside phosphotransferase (APT) family kinase protein